MRLSEFLSKYSSNGEQASSQTPSETANQSEEITTGTKVKIVLALMVVGFAGYVAYWVQEPTGLRADVLDPGSQTEISSTQTQPAVTQSETVVSTQADTQTQTDTQSQTQVASMTQEISITNFTYDPQTVEVDKGVTVVWTNKDPVPHTITGDNFSSGPLSPGQSFSYTFNEDGTFAYHCSLHPQMTGTIVAGTGVSASTQAQTQAQTQVAVSNTQASTQTQTVENTNAQLATDPEAYYATAQAPAKDLHGAAVEPLSSSVKKVVNSTNLASSGPEDYMYLGVAALALFLNRKKLLKSFAK